MYRREVADSILDEKDTSEMVSAYLHNAFYKRANGKDS